MQKLYTFLGGRKLTFALIITLLITVFVFTNKANVSEWMEIIVWIFGIYAGGNVGEWVAKKNK